MTEPVTPAESIDVAPSEDNGNVPAETLETPAQTPAAPAVTEPVATVASELYELPDGRKVDGQTLAKEWKENFAPEFTRKSQELATLKQGKESTLPNPNPTNPTTDPNWVPQTYGEIIQLAKRSALEEIEQKEQARVSAQKALEDAVANQLSEVKKLDPGLNENALFLHANKYGFRDLKAAHTNMKDMGEIVKKVQQTTAANIQKRNDPVSVLPGATGTKLDPSAFASARDYLRALKGQ